MSQHADIALLQLRYNRSDYTVLRAYSSKSPIERIADLHNSEDSPEDEQGLKHFLIRMRNHLIERTARGVQVAAYLCGADGMNRPPASASLGCATTWRQSTVSSRAMTIRKRRSGCTAKNWSTWSCSVS